MDVTPSQLQRHLSDAPASMLAQTLSPTYGGERFSCLRCQLHLRRQVMSGGHVFGSPTFRRYTDSITTGPSASFVDPMRWKCADCGAGGLRTDVQRHITRDPDLTVRFLAALAEVSRAA